MTAEREQLVEAHLWLARKIARSYCIRSRRHHAYDHAYSDACLGLVQAALRWDPDHGASFRTFATRRMLGQVLDGARESSPLSRGQYKRGERLPDDLPLDATIVQNSDVTWGDQIADPRADLDQARWKTEALALLEPLPARERKIMVQLALGETMQEIADREGVSESRISQIASRARQRIQVAA